MNGLDWTRFFAMGGYGLYVWGSYAVFVLALVLEPLLLRGRHRRALAVLADESPGLAPAFPDPDHKETP